MSDLIRFQRTQVVTEVSWSFRRDDVPDVLLPLFDGRDLDDLDEAGRDAVDELLDDVDWKVTDTDDGGMRVWTE